MKLLALIATLTLTASFAQAIQPATIEITAVQPQSQTISYNFGRRPVNSFSTMRFDITNRGYEPVAFEGAFVYGANYDARHSCQHGIPAKSRCWVEIRYWPAFEGMHSGEVQMHFRGNNDIRILLWGEATRW